MPLNIIQKQLNKTYTANSVQKTSKTTITIVGDYDLEKDTGDGLFIDSNRLLRDPTLVLHIARWAGYKVVDKTADEQQEDIDDQQQYELVVRKPDKSL